MLDDLPQVGPSPTARPGPARRPMTLTLLLSACLLLGACSGKGAGAGFQMPPPEVTVVTLKTQPVSLQRQLPGRVSAHLVADVRPQVNGIIRRVLFKEGSQVERGQTLYELDDRVYRAALDSAQAAQLKSEAGVEVAHLNAARGTELLKTKSIAVQDNDNLQATLKQAEADLAASKAAVEYARINLAFARITSPITGRIGKSTATEGALVVANQADALSTVQELNPVFVDVTQSSGEWLQLRRDLGRTDMAKASRTATISLEDGSKYPQPGALQFTDVTVDAGTGSFLLRVLVPNPEALLRPGMYVNATVDEGTLPDGLLAPQQGITRDPKGSATALIVGADDKVEQRSVSVSRTVGDQWLVSDGLKAGDRLIVEGVQKVQPGMAVKAVPAGPSVSAGPSVPAASSVPAGPAASAAK